MGKSVSDYMKIAWNVFGKKVVNRMVSEKLPLLSETSALNIRLRLSIRKI